MTTPNPSVPLESGEPDTTHEAALVAPKPEAKLAEAKPAAAKPAAAKAVIKPAAKPVVEAQPSPTPSPGVSGAEAARALRKARARRLLLGLTFWVGLPVLLATVYYGALAQPQYESVASFAVRGPEATARAAMLREYIASPEMRAALDKKDGFFAHFTASRDPLARLSAKAGSEARAHSYREHVQTEYDHQTGIFMLRVRAFSGKAAAAFARTIASESRHMFARIDDEAAGRRLAEAEKDLSEARARLLAVERNGDSAEAPRAAAATVRVTVEAREQKVSEDLAEREVEMALTALSQVRASVRAREAPLITISKPSTPSEAAYPRRFYGVMTVLFVSLSLFGIGALLISAVREHAQF